MSIASNIFEEKFNSIEFDSDTHIAELDIINESISLMELSSELHSITELSNVDIAIYDINKSIATEGETLDKIKSGAKAIFMKIIAWIRKALNFIFEIVTFPFRLIAGLFKKQTPRDILNLAKKRLEKSNRKVDDWYSGAVAKNAKEIINVIGTTTKTSKEILIQHTKDMQRMRVLSNEWNEIKKKVDASDGDYIASDEELVHIENMKREFKMMGVRYDEYENAVNTEFMENTISEIKRAKESKISVEGKTVCSEFELVVVIIESIQNNNATYKSIQDSTKEMQQELSKLENALKNLDDNDKARPLFVTGVRMIQTHVAKLVKTDRLFSEFFSIITSQVSTIKKIVEKPLGLDMSIDTIGEPIDDICGIPIYHSQEWLDMSGVGGAMAVHRTALDDIPEYRKSFPNGFIVIGDDAIKWKTSNPRLYAFTIGHEYGHIAKDHTAPRIFAQQIAQKTDLNSHDASVLENEADSVGSVLAKLVSPQEKNKILNILADTSNSGREQMKNRYS